MRYYGGHFAIGSTVHPDKDRFGVRFSAAPGAYVAHNRHLFDGPGFELQAVFGGAAQRLRAGASGCLAAAAPRICRGACGGRGGSG